MEVRCASQNREKNINSFTINVSIEVHFITKVNVAFFVKELLSVCLK